MELIGATSTDIWWATTIWVEYERAHKVVNKKDGRAEGYNICSTKTIAAPVADVYAAWTDAGALCQWFGAKMKVDVTERGKWNDGDGNSGEYQRVGVNKDLRFTCNHADGGVALVGSISGRSLNVCHWLCQCFPELNLKQVG